MEVKSCSCELLEFDARFDQEHVFEVGGPNYASALPRQRLPTRQQRGDVRAEDDHARARAQHAITVQAVEQARLFGFAAIGLEGFGADPRRDQFGRVILGRPRDLRS